MNVQQTQIAAADTLSRREAGSGWHAQIPDDKAMLRAARDLTKDISAHRADIYWADMIASALVGYGALAGAILTGSLPLAILLARAIRGALAESSGQTRLLGVSATVAGVVVATLAVLVYAARALLVEWDEAWTLVVASAVLVSGVALAVTALASLVRSSPRARALRSVVPALTAAAAVFAALGAHYVVLSSPGPAPVERMATMIREARGAGEPYGRYRAFNRNLLFYTGAPHIELPALDAARDFLGSSERVLCVLPGADAARLESEGLRLTHLGEIRYLNTGSLTLRTLLDPDPERYLQRVVLVANR